MADNEKMEYLMISTDAVVVSIVSEPRVVMTYRGYAPVVEVQIEGEDAPKLMYINSKSISTTLESLKNENQGKFSGIKIRIRKESNDKFAKYIINKASDAVIQGEEVVD
ncbi:hypothetical protein ACFL3D_05735 [Candidatus Omnitrophota bacterium]